LTSENSAGADLLRFNDGSWMFGRPFPPLPDPGVLCRRMARLAAQASLAVHKQHLVSGVLLGQFAAPC
jgi:hypothetical protein